MNRPATALIPAREFAVVGVMGLGFGLVGVDRFLITTMFPAIAKDLHLSYGDIGTIAGVLAFAWGFAALLMGNLSDRIGRHPVLVGSLVVFSLLIGASGLATGLMGLIAMRIVMGIADGAYTPVSITATLESSSPKRYGLNIGLQQMMLPLCGLGFSSILVGFLLKFITWRYIFVLFTIPGLILAYAVYRIVPKKRAGHVEIPLEAIAHGHGANLLADWKHVIGYRNVQVAMGMMLCWLTCLTTTANLLPNYMVDHLGLSTPSMGFVMSAIGWGSAAGTITLPTFSDWLGRKPVMLVSCVGVAASLLLYSRTGANPAVLFAFLFAVHFFNNALITLTVGPICTGAVPISLMATASGRVIATGEFFGGGIAPIVSGQVAEHFGIQNILWLPIGAMGLALVFCAFLRETHGKSAI
jgi:predicted MFS family arabinose efflux permease